MLDITQRQWSLPASGLGQGEDTLGAPVFLPTHAGSQSRGSEATVPGWGQAWLSLNACIFSAPPPKCSALSSEVLQREPEEKPNLGEWDKPHSQDVPFQGPCPSCPKPLISTVLLGPQAPRSPGKPSSPVSPAAPTMHLHAAGRTTHEPATALPWAAAGTHPPSPTIILDTTAPFQALLSPQLNHSFIHFFRKGHVHRLRTTA